MSNEKRGSEKLLDMEDALSPLTEEELMQVAGGAQLVDMLSIKGYFPLGTLPPDLFTELSLSRDLERNDLLKAQLDIPMDRSISNGF